jgi:hypothetical protein
MKPDLIVSHINQTTLFKPQNLQVSRWLRQRFHLPSETDSGHTEFHVHPTQTKKIIEELKAAGFKVGEPLQ